MSSSKLIKTISVATSVLSIGASAVLWYWTYKYIYKQVNEDSEQDFKSSDDSSDSFKIIRMKIPSYSKGAIIGKNGTTIRKIQEKTKTTIKFVTKSSKVLTKDGDQDSSCEWTVDLTKDNSCESFDILLIRGLTLRVMEAEKEIKTIIDAVPVYCVDQMIIDNRFVGKIIGKKGENVRRLKELYKVQIDIDKSNNVNREVIFRGTRENIAECKLDIIKMIDSELVKENRFNPTMRGREKFGDTNTDYKSVNGLVNNELINRQEFQESFVAYPGVMNEKVFIYVSSVVDCSKFYAHIVGNGLITLETLIEEMTEHFSKIKFQPDSAFKVADIVAGFYDASQTWQRVKILAIDGNLCEVIYLDYGDSSKIKLDDLRAFDKNSKYLMLPFQAILLTTYGIQPISDNWTESDINEFEALTKVGYSHKITAIMMSNNHMSPEVQLIDEEDNIDICRKLVADGKARFCN